MPAIRIFSYLPNPRLWKATIPGRIGGVDVEIRGASPPELVNWLWDFDARVLDDAQKVANERFRRVGRVGFKGGDLYKTDAFLDAHPFGDVPAAFSSDGATGIFESNSILRAVARLADPALGLYGRDALEASRIDSFLDATLVFGKDTQTYVLAARDRSLTPEVHALGAQALAAYLRGIERALSPSRQWLVGDRLTIADIGFVAELSLFCSERHLAAWLGERGFEPLIRRSTLAAYPRALGHFERLAAHPAFAPDVGPYLAAMPAMPA